MLLYTEIDVVQRNGATDKSSCRVMVDNGHRWVLVSHSSSGLNGYQFATNFNATAAEGTINFSSFEGMFGHMVLDTDGTFEGSMPSDLTDTTYAFYDDHSSTSGATVNIGTGSQSGNEFDIKRLIAFKL